MQCNNWLCSNGRLVMARVDTSPDFTPSEKVKGVNQPCDEYFRFYPLISLNGALYSLVTDPRHDRVSLTLTLTGAGPDSRPRPDVHVASPQISKTSSRLSRRRGRPAMATEHGMHRCTCAPHPRIDLADLHSGRPEDLPSSCRERVRNACRSHGCFHVAIAVDLRRGDDDGAGGASPLECLAKPRRRVEEDIESLFSPAFLRDAVRPSRERTPRTGDSPARPGPGGDAPSARDDWEGICDGGLVDVRFGSKHAAATEATFRGRVAESGDEKQAVPEPKLSWEVKRCNVADVPQKTRNGSSCSLLMKWTEALHSVATTIVRLLEIPPRIALQENRCPCMSRQNRNEGGESNCNIDLLRVFRYDAVPHQPQNNNESFMGSSAHSDWGTLTVVWQDGRGGLQTYCHSCKRWSDVDAKDHSSADAAASEPSTGTVSLFVHVGDFLSLATAGLSDGEIGGFPAWPSPRHRVLCPTARRSPDGDDADDCRRSLVYFAYPPPGVSLDDARKIVAPLAARSSPINSSDKKNAGFYDCYSLLHNQSRNSSSVKESTDEKELVAFRTHQRIRGVSFDEVINEKWNQVQRKATQDQKDTSS